MFIGERERHVWLIVVGELRGPRNGAGGAGGRSVRASGIRLRWEGSCDVGRIALDNHVDLTVRT